MRTKKGLEKIWKSFYEWLEIKKECELNKDTKGKVNFLKWYGLSPSKFSPSFFDFPLYNC